MRLRRVELLMHADLPIIAFILVEKFTLLFRFVEITRRDMHEWLNKTLMQEKDVGYY